MSPKYIELFTNVDTLDDDRPNNVNETVDDDEEENSRRWLAWMTSGVGSNTPRGSAEVIMRDPVALGGLPRAERYASRDWLHNTINMPNSVILKSVRFPVLFMTTWGFCISLLHRMLKNGGMEEVASKLCIPTAPHSLMVSALGLLLVFRTNSAYQRFSEGRKIWEEILSTARDLSRLVKLYEGPIGSSKLRRLNRLLAAFPYLLRFRIRPNSIMKKIDDPDFTRDPEFSLILYQDHAISDSDAEAAAVASDEETTGISRRRPRELYWVDKRTLPWRLLPSQAMEECARAQNRPLWVCDRMAKELHSVPDSEYFTARERLALLSKVDKLSGTIGSCERIHQTVVPLNYARHALRSLTMWLLSLPFALVKDLGLMTGPTLFLISWMLFGVYEIGYSIEDPFQGTLRLSILCDAIRRDVLGDEIIRNTAFNLKNEDKAAKIGGESKLEYYEEDDDDDDLGAEEEISIEIEDIIIDEVGEIVNTAEENEADSIIDNDSDVGFVRPPQANGAVVQVKEKQKEPSVSP
mmetsp:Transcript_18068/g.22776  ORF Transcript_18068/g.22776 Transcript_18068/m.22776 type:complete len:523 (-) Transcript_18068:115-1683(-)